MPHENFDAINLSQSSIVSDIEMRWLLNQLPEKAKSIILLFSSSVHGWKKVDWRKACVGKTTTLTIMKTTKNRICGGYCHIAWENDPVGRFGKDEHAFLFQVNDRLKLTTPNKAKTIRFHSNFGP